LIASTTSRDAIFVLSWKTFTPLIPAKAPADGIPWKSRGTPAILQVDGGQSASTYRRRVAP
jgi:hypothetical protein